MSSAIFRPDMRNLGGQKDVMTLMQNHYSAMVHVKPTMNTRVAPRSHVASQQKKRMRPMSAKGEGLRKMDHDLITDPKFNE